MDTVISEPVARPNRTASSATPASESRKPYRAPRITSLGPVEVITCDGGGGDVDAFGTAQI